MTLQKDRAPGPADDHEPTQVLASTDERQEPTQVLAPADERQEPTQVLAPADERQEPTQVLAPADERQEPTQVLASTDEHAITLPLGPAEGRRGAGGGHEPAGPEYSATVLGSQWIQGPERDDTLPAPSAPTTWPTPPTDPGEDTVLRFGPGVTAAVAQRTHRTLPTLPVQPVRPRRNLRRHTLPAVVLLCVLAFLAWQRLGPSVEVSTVAVTSRPTVLGCEGTADIVAVVRTNGRPGTLSYRWIRSDGTSSGVLREEVVRGQRQARLHLLWTFRGEGHRTARAELRILSPAHRTVATRFTYDCR
ncbi:hypothetical protein ACFYNL_04915 [Streptomyces sp. NPDC007808]|uniref:hypothetical protein n=1 Tax=Streptomyces sp. NPDC007808 TaxID=3364779 RepID=UPI003678B4F7